MHTPAIKLKPWMHELQFSRLSPVQELQLSVQASHFSDTWFKYYPDKHSQGLPDAFSMQLWQYSLKFSQIKHISSGQRLHDMLFLTQP